MKRGLLGCYLLAIATLSLANKISRADDWPTFRRSPTRNAVSNETLPAGKPSVDWRHDPAFKPTPAWHGPAKWDAYAELRGLHSMRSYDQAYHTIAASDSIYYASSAEDCVRRLNAINGQVDWTFFTDGPVRVTPTFHDGRVYFGSDDGHAYCVDAETGEQIWRYGQHAGGRKILYNGKFIPLWPVRTGVTVVEDTAYFAASLLPWEPSHLFAVDVETGEQRYAKQLDAVTLEAPLVASPRFLIAPQGRVEPLIFNRADGRQLGTVTGGGGSLVVLIDDNTIMHGPGNKEGWITESNADAPSEALATHKSARAVVNFNKVTYFITDTAAVAIDYKTKRRIWQTDVAEPLAMIATQNALIVGGLEHVTAIDTATGDELWSMPVDGRAHGLTFADGRLYVSLDTGRIIALSMPVEERESDEPRQARANRRRVRALPVSAAVPADGAENQSDVESEQGEESDAVTEQGDNEDADTKQTAVAPPVHRVTVGPSLRFLSETTAEVLWQTDQTTPSRLVWHDGDEVRELVDLQAKTNHRMLIDGLKHNHIYGYELVDQTAAGEQITTKVYECDTFFNYEHENDETKIDLITDEAKAAAAEILDRCDARKGVCLVLGASNDLQIELALATATGFKLIVFDPDRQKVQAARERLLELGLYGERISVLPADEKYLQTVTDRTASLIVSGAMFDGDALPYPQAEVSRLLSPTGVAVLSNADEPADWSTIHGEHLPGASDWAHIYGATDNSAFAGESLGGVKTTDDLAVQWMGRPGPRYQADRNGRKTPPVAAGGRLYLQGLDRIVTVDAYNGAVLWSWELPHFRRFNMPRDCGNWCADEDKLYAAIRDRCWVIDGQTGEIDSMWKVPAEGLAQSDDGYDWGYIARAGEFVVGSACRTGTGWTDWKNFWGGDGWYDATSGPATQQVAADRLFVMPREGGEPIWKRDALVLHSTITISDGVIFFAECLDESTAQSTNRRLEPGKVWNNLKLVAVELATGEEIWTKPLTSMETGNVVFWVAASGGKLVLVCSSEPKFDIYALSAKDGEQLWHQQTPWGKGKADHGTHLSRPAIVGNRLVVRPAVFNLQTGEKSEEEMPVSGCGTYACTTDAMFFRAWSGQEFAVWSPESGAYTRWNRLRPDCWLSSIPAGGLLLSPEGGGGCSCGSWLETSLAFIPKAHLQNGVD